MSGDEATSAVIDALEKASVPYMLVDSLASNVYGVARATHDADFVVQCDLTGIQEVARLLGPQFNLDPQATFETITTTTRYAIDVQQSSFRIELFVLSADDHDLERFQRRVAVTVQNFGKSVFVPTPEDVIVTKLRWALGSQRGKDYDDVRNVIAVQGTRLDWEYIERWSDEHGTRSLLDEIRAGLPPADEDS